MARSALCLIGLAVAFGLGACGSDESPSKSSAQPSATASPAATESSNNNYGY